MAAQRTVTLSEELNSELEKFNLENPNHKIRPSQVFQAALSEEIKYRTELSR